jgi:uncharacterized protein YebE (UPF0316 family)
MTKLFIIFVALNIVNVILQTAKSIATVKCGKVAAALVNALAYGLYTIVIVYTNCELDLWVKVGVVALTNLIGVYVVKLIEEKMRKDKLWKIDLTVNAEYKNNVISMLDSWNIPYAYNEYGKHILFSVYAQTQRQSEYVGELVKLYNGKYFVSENGGIL